MKKFILAFLIASGVAWAAGRIQNEDVKSLSDLTGAGGSASQLINDTKIYVTANSLNKQLSAAITAGDIGGGGYSVKTAQTLAAAGSVTATTTDRRQFIPVSGTSASVIMSSTPFGNAGGWIDGTEVVLEGQSDANNVTMSYSDTTNGAVGPFSVNGLNIGKWQTIKCVWRNGESRWICNYGGL